MANTSAARSNSSACHCPIWFGWTLNCSDSSTMVLSPLIAASATFALKVAEWLRRDRFISSAPRRHGRLLEQSYQLKPVSSFLGALLFFRRDPALGEWV